MGVHLVFFLHITTGSESFNHVLALAFGVLIVFLLRITVDQDPSQSQHGVNGASHSDAALDCWSMILFRKPGIFQDQALVLVGVQLAFPFWGRRIAYGHNCLADRSGNQLPVPRWPI